MTRADPENGSAFASHTCSCSSSSRYHLPGMVREVAQHRELPGRQLDARRPVDGRVCREVDLDVADPNLASPVARLGGQGRERAPSARRTQTA